MVEFVLDGDDDFLTNQDPQPYLIELKIKQIPEVSLCWSAQWFTQESAPECCLNGI